MDPKSRQTALNNVSPEDLAKVKAHQASTKGSHAVDQEWLLLAEFAKAYGWEAYKDARDDNITAAEMLTLVEANRRLEFRQMFWNSQASFIGAASSRTKNPTATFTKLTNSIVKKTKVDE